MEKKSKNFLAPVPLWLALLPEPYNHKALQYLNDDAIDASVSNFSDALNRAFPWDATPDGFRYWLDLFFKLQREGL